MNQETIDFVLPWVDGSDSAWLEEKSRYEDEVLDPEVNDGPERYRDWDLLKYWFRGVEKFAPWVNQIHFVTWGHIPKWLNVQHKKIHIVNHSSFIPKEYLPTFNSSVIMINLHRIPNLSENFVLFNDDMFLISPTQPNDFFKNNKPCLSAAHIPYRIAKNDNFFCPFNNVSIINEHFSMRKCILGNITKWITPKNGINNISTLLMLPFPAFYGFYDSHLPAPYKKSTYQEVWEKEGSYLRKECSNRFRTPFDVNEFLIKNWQVASGNFFAAPISRGKNFNLTNCSKQDIDDVAAFIKQQKALMVCINDGRMKDENIEYLQKTISATLDSILPNKSKFELY